MWKIAFLIITDVMYGFYMKPLHELIILNHFYYCFLLAIKLRKCNLPLVDGINSKVFMKQWLFTAQNNRLFDRLIYDEIQWLLDSLSDRKTTSQQFEYNIEIIYHRSLEMIKENESLVPRVDFINF
ncbi:hypothetical protein LOF13_23345 [Klebsiella pneumoniae subsp. pneumoniae]|nr:hypothetical protein LOF13_23345 [Klebsiella pneumoniae subsp. pneumoniae]